jgi:hypothetical protein
MFVSDRKIRLNVKLKIEIRSKIKFKYSNLKQTLTFYSIVSKILND